MSQKTQKTRLFEYESLQNKKHVVQYLQAVIQGIEKGELTLSDEEEHLILHPKEMMQLNIRGKQGKNKQELRFKLTWSNTLSPQKTTSPLSIQPKQKSKKSQS